MSNANVYLLLLIFGAFAFFLAGRELGKSEEYLKADRMLIAARLPDVCWRRLETGYDELRAMEEFLHDMPDPR